MQPKKKNPKCVRMYFPINILLNNLWGCSYAWRSILQARDVINKGAIWRVGNGELIDIWRHRWLPDLHYSKIISPRANTSVIRVCELFVPHTKIWDPGKLALCFLPWEAEKVSQIQVCSDGEEDVLIWPLTADGEYSVRSAYHLLVAAEECLAPSSSSLAHNHTVWKQIWKMKVPNKIRHFIWRAAKDSLPTKVNLKARNVSVDVVCEGCGDYSESTLHSLWLCDQAREVWMSGSEFQFLIRRGCRSFVELLEYLFREGSGLQVAVFATICWCLWQRRNRVRMHQPSWQVHEIEGQAKRMVREFWDANNQGQHRSMRRPPVRWSPPPAGTYKANFDAAIFEELQCVGLGVVFRDHSGQVIAALSQRIGLSRTVELAEALAARRAVEFARELSLFDVILEGDCLRVVQALNASGGCNTLYGHVVNETKRLGADLRHCSYQHVCREGNKLAHCLARRAVSSADIDVWVEDLPEDLDVVLQSDLS
ncbi:hypothetical protein SO802_018649 [Lithocarpus litseifolius]|uniref:Reverse transcriptase zinc-binding domain-containing protein n=1 Tax=Lithocarpus litseifolius TaxID=425828 RepID=A0AAW2CLD6_9ROSI